MTVTHIVMFKFKDTSASEDVKELCQKMEALGTTCLHPETGKPYIKSFYGGKDNSVQGLQNGMSHVFVVEFENVADRDYYALTDPAHLEFVRWSDTVTSAVQTIDFRNGKYDC